MRTKRFTAVVLAAALAGTISTGAASAGAPPTMKGRVDLDPPTFTNPTAITNPLFPMSDLDQVIQLGAEGDVALRHDVTKLEETKVINWNGVDIEAVVSQFVAYGDGEILEIATDYFAQADDGSVWYLGEDVTNYEDGQVLDNDGTWLAGRDGPAGMIMPAHPKVGDTFRPENIPGLVFEEVTVKKVDLTVNGPTGPVSGAIKVLEELQDGSVEDKFYAPGYGEFQAIVAESEELVTVAVAAPTDLAAGREPRAMDRLSEGADKLFRAAPHHRWARLARLANIAKRDATKLRKSGVVPPLVQDEIDSAIGDLKSAVRRHKIRALREAAIDLELATLDVELRYDDGDDVDRDRLDAWRLQLSIDRAAGDTAAVASDRVILQAIRSRLGD